MVDITQNLNRQPSALSRLRVRDFRKIEALDVEFPPDCQVICFVGPNGSGKSSLLSLLVDSLCQLTTESGPDLPRGLNEANGMEIRSRTTNSGEVRATTSAALLRADWFLNHRPFSYKFVIKRVIDTKPLGELFPGESDLSNISFSDGSFLAATWNPPANPVDDPIARSVLLLRPADRWEKPSYEEPPNLAVSPALQGNWMGQRLFPVRVRTWGAALEQFLLQLELDRSTEAGAAAEALNLWNSVFADLTGGPFQKKICRWPFTRIGPTYNPQMSCLSAGELDVLVTAAIILSQSLGLQQKFGEEAFSPKGIVFIDEIDAHLHPQWQQKVVPILTKHFPEITFIITTHSPFVLRSLHRATSRVVRLPDGQEFDTDFDAWQIEDILGAVFEVSAAWTPEITDQLVRLRALVKDSRQVNAALHLYEELDGLDSAGLKAEIKRIAALYGTMEFVDSVAQKTRAKPENGEPITSTAGTN